MDEKEIKRMMNELGISYSEAVSLYEQAVKQYRSNPSSVGTVQVKKKEQTGLPNGGTGISPLKSTSTLGSNAELDLLTNPTAGDIFQNPESPSAKKAQKLKKQQNDERISRVMNKTQLGIVTENDLSEITDSPEGQIFVKNFLKTYGGSEAASIPDDYLLATGPQWESSIKNATKQLRRNYAPKVQEYDNMDGMDLSQKLRSIRLNGVDNNSQVVPVIDVDNNQSIANAINSLKKIGNYATFNQNLAKANQQVTGSGLAGMKISGANYNPTEINSFIGRLYNRVKLNLVRDNTPLDTELVSGPVRLRVQAAKGKGIKNEEDAALDFAQGLRYLEITDPVRAATAKKAMKELGMVDDMLFEQASEIGREIRNERTLRGSSSNPELIGKGSQNQYMGNSYQSQKAGASSVIGEILKSRQKGFNAVMGKREYSEQEIRDAAAEAERRGIKIDKSIVDDLVFEEDLPGYDAIPKSGVIDSFIRGFNAPFQNISNTIQNIGVSDSEKYLQSQELDNVSKQSGQQVKYDDGTTGGALFSDKGNLFYQAVEGFGQFIPQVILTRGLGSGFGVAARAISSSAGVGNTVTNFTGTLISSYLQEYDANYKQAILMTEDPAKRGWIAGLNSLAAAAFETVLPETKIGDKISGLRKKMASTLIDLTEDGLKDLPNKVGSFARAYIAEAGNILGQEISEEVGTLFTNTLVNSVLAPNYDAGDLGAQLKETVQATAIQTLIPALLGGAGSARNRNIMTKDALHGLALNYDNYESILNNAVVDGQLEQGQANRVLAIIGAHRESLNESPKQDNEGGQLTVQQRKEYAFQNTLYKIAAKKLEGQNDPVLRAQIEAEIADINSQKQAILSPTKINQDEKVTEPTQQASEAEKTNAAPAQAINEEEAVLSNAFADVAPETINQSVNNSQQNESQVVPDININQDAVQSSQISDQESSLAKSVGPEITARAAEYVGKLVDDGIIKDTLANAKENPLSFLQLIKDQNESNPESTSNQFPKELIDFAYNALENTQEFPKDNSKVSAGETFISNGKKYLIGKVDGDKVTIYPTEKTVGAVGIRMPISKLLESNPIFVNNPQNVADETNIVQEQQATAKPNLAEGGDNMQKARGAENARPAKGRKGNFTNKDLRQVKDPVMKSALDIENPNAEQQVKHYFIGGGQVNSGLIQELFGGANRINQKNIKGEVSSKLSLISNSRGAQTIESLAHDLWENQPTPEQYSEIDFRDNIESVLRDFNTAKEMAESIVSQIEDFNQQEAKYYEQLAQQYGEYITNAAIDIAENLSDNQIESIVEETPIEEIMSNAEQNGWKEIDFELFAGQFNTNKIDVGKIETGIANYFYSPLLRKVSEVKQDKLTVGKWNSLLNGEEAKIVGLPNFFKQRNGQDQVSKKDILDLIHENRVRISVKLVNDKNYTIRGINSQTEYEKYRNIAIGKDLKLPAYKSMEYGELFIKWDNPNTEYFGKKHYIKERNILVHTRYSIIKDRDGVDSIFIEEIQSDWGQDLRKYGKEKVPDAPFIGNTSDWVKLAGKAIEALSKQYGISQVIIPAGKFHVARYSTIINGLQLYKMDKVEYELNESGSVTLRFFNDKGEVVNSETVDDYNFRTFYPFSSRAYYQKDTNNITRGELRGSDVGFYKRVMDAFYGTEKMGDNGIVGNVLSSLYKQEPKTVHLYKNDRIEDSAYRFYAFDIEPGYSENSRSLFASDYYSTENGYDRINERAASFENSPKSEIIATTAKTIEDAVLKLEDDGGVVWQDFPNEQRMDDAGIDRNTDDEEFAGTFRGGYGNNSLHKYGMGIYPNSGEQDVANKTLSQILSEPGFSNKQRGMAAAYIASERLLSRGEGDFISAAFRNFANKSSNYRGRIRIVYDNSLLAHSVSANAEGYISFNAAKLGDKIEEFGNDQNKFLSWMEAALEEEVIHLATFKVSTPEDFKAVFSEMTNEQKELVAGAYGQSLESLSEFQVAGEYIRMIVQDRVFGRVTEMQKPQSISDSIRRVLLKLIDRIKEVFGNSPKANEIVDRVEIALKNAHKSNAVKSGLKSEFKNLDLNASNQQNDVLKRLVEFGMLDRYKSYDEFKNRAMTEIGLRPDLVTSLSPLVEENMKRGYAISKIVYGYQDKALSKSQVQENLDKYAAKYKITDSEKQLISSFFDDANNKEQSEVEKLKIETDNELMSKTEYSILVNEPDGTFFNENISDEELLNQYIENRRRAGQKKYTKEQSKIIENLFDEEKRFRQQMKDLAKSFDGKTPIARMPMNMLLTRLARESNDMSRIFEKALSYKKVSGMSSFMDEAKETLSFLTERYGEDGAADQLNILLNQYENDYAPEMQARIPYYQAVLIEELSRVGRNELAGKIFLDSKRRSQDAGRFLRAVRDVYEYLDRRVLNADAKKAEIREVLKAINNNAYQRIMELNSRNSELSNMVVQASQQAANQMKALTLVKALGNKVAKAVEKICKTIIGKK